jgi:dipeptidyl-peptidase 4
MPSEQPSQPPSYPRLAARTQRFTLGIPRDFAVAPDGSRVAFLRAPSGTDRATCLWVLDLDSGAPAERLVADPRRLLSGAEQLPPEERARRERLREGAAGIVGYATDRAVTVATFALSGELYVVPLHGAASEPVRLDVRGPVVDPRPDPTGRHVAYVAHGSLRVASIDGTADRALAEPEGEHVMWGLAEFIAAEEMGRSRGFWWSPDGTALLAARVDESPVQRWHLADPARPEVAPAEVAYPRAGTANADVSLLVVHLDGRRIDVTWPADEFPYLARVHWSQYGPPLLHVQSRDQRRAQTLAVNAATGRAEVVHSDADGAWLDLLPGIPQWAPGGRLVRVETRDGTRRLVVGDEVISAATYVRDVVDAAERDNADGRRAGANAGGGGVVYTASTDDPTQIHVFRGNRRVSPEPGVHAAAAAGPLLVLSSSSLEWPGRRTRVYRDGVEIATIASYAEIPPLRPRVTLLQAGRREIRTAVLLPTDHEPGSRKLPVLMDPYGGPGAQRVLAARNAFLEPQWWADQGFAVVVADGRGTPGRSPAWEREIALDLATGVLDDQVEALHASAETYDDMDLSRVAIRGWSFGGYLAALAVLRRPDVFRAAVAGAPVTDWRLYDTHYTERYIGHPDEHPEAYDRCSLIEDAAKLERPLLLIHGLADDNVVAAHTLRLSSALLAAGRPHSVLPLSGVTHMTPQEVVAENLLLFQLDFLRRALG